jgi:hypothetical protein
VGVAATVKVTGVDDAVPPAKELTVSQEGGAFVASSTVKGVPPVAVEVIEMVWAGPGVHVGVPLGLVYVQVIVTPEAARPEVVEVTVSATVAVFAVPLAGVNVSVVLPVLLPAQPGAALTEYVRVWLAKVKV